MSNVKSLFSHSVNNTIHKPPVQWQFHRRFGGIIWCRSTSKPSCSRPSSVRRRSNRFWNTPPLKATFALPECSRAALQAATICSASVPVKQISQCSAVSALQFCFHDLLHQCFCISKQCSSDSNYNSWRILCLSLNSDVCFCSKASAANCSAVDASPSKLDCRRIPRIALTASKSRPALVDITALILRSAIVNCTLLSCSLHSPSFSMISHAFPGLWYIRRSWIRQYAIPLCRGVSADL